MTRFRDLLPRWQLSPRIPLAAKESSGDQAHGRAQMEQPRCDDARAASEVLPIDGRALPLIRALVVQAKRRQEWARAQSRFVAYASHQLRAPLTLLRAQVDQALLQTEIGAMREVVARLQETTDVTGRLVGQLLALARSESGRYLDMSDVDLVELAHQAAFDLLPLARAKRIDLGFGGAGRLVVRGESVLLRELVFNLVHNAISYTQEGGIVTVSVAVRHGRPRLRVIDDGPGVPPSERAKVLERFYRIPGTGMQGSGLGLAIVKEICARHAIRLALRDAPNGSSGLCVDLKWPAPKGAVSRGREHRVDHDQDQQDGAKGGPVIG